MVKRRSAASTKRKVVTSLPVSQPADAPLTRADQEEVIREPASTSAVSTATADDSTPSGRPLRVYADGEIALVRLGSRWRHLLTKPGAQSCHAGIFDLFHFGHAKALEQAKKM